MIRLTYVLALLLCSFALAPVAIADSVVERVVGSTEKNKGKEIGQMNWSTGVLEVKGFGVAAAKFRSDPARAKFMAIRAAKVDAQRNALESIGAVHLESTTVNNSGVAESDLVRSTIRGILTGAKVVRQDVAADGWATVVLRIDYRKKMAATITGIAQEKLNIPFSPSSVPAAMRGGSSQTQPISGIIIDATSLTFTGAHWPQIYSSDGATLYSVNMVAPEKRVMIAKYIKGGVQTAMNEARAGSHPLVLKPLRVQDNVNFVLSNADSRLLRQASGYQQVARNANVVIVE